MNPAEIERLWQLCFGSTEGSPAIAASDAGAATGVDAVLLIEALDSHDDAAALAALGRITARLVPQVVWLRDSPADLVQKDALRALGFEPAGAFGDRFAYAYDLARANQPRDWNTPHNWANPSQFSKRW